MALGIYRADYFTVARYHLGPGECSRAHRAILGRTTHETVFARKQAHFTVALVLATSLHNGEYPILSSCHHRVTGTRKTVLNAHGHRPEP
jgi:hypothetical protein